MEALVLSSLPSDIPKIRPMTGRLDAGAQSIRAGALAGDGAALSARGFTGHPQLDRTGYVNMGGRLYDPALGRFLSPDPAVSDWRSSQDWNPYSYVANRPLSQVDPSGAVRAGPGCSLVSGVACLDSGGGPDAGGGFTERAVQAWSLSLSVDWRVAWTPVVQVGPGFGDWGFRGLGFNVSYLPIAYPVITGSLRQVNAQAVADRQPADEPILSPGEAASVAVGAVPVVGSIQSGVEVLTGYDYIADEPVNRVLAAAGILAGAVPGGKAALKGGSKVVDAVQGHLARGRRNEARVLEELGLPKNTRKVSGREGRSIPDVLTDAMSVEIKDAKRVYSTRQLRIQAEAAGRSGQKPILITGEKTCVSAWCNEMFEVLRRSDLGPQ